MKTIAIKAAKEAGKIQMKYFQKDFDVRSKKDSSLVTSVDIKCTKAVRKIISSKYPTHSILCEELGEKSKKSDYRWIIDPIDGTHNFIMGNPLFSISIALQYKDSVVLGVMYFPALKKLYHAEKGRGAYCNGKRIHVSKGKCSVMIFDAKVSTRTRQKLKFLGKLATEWRRLRVFGAATYHNALVAEGKADVNIDFDSKPWDHAAGLFIVCEAGGMVTDMQGKPWTVDIKDYIASNSARHNRILSFYK